MKHRHLTYWQRNPSQERSLRDNASLVTVTRDKHFSVIMKSTNYNVEKTFSVCWSCIARKSNWILFTGRVAWLGAKWRRWSPIMTLTTKNKLNTFHHHIRVWSIKVLNIYIYEGSENPFLITRVYSTKWLCTYDMLFYPFDTQVKETQFWIGKHIMFQLALYRVVPCCWHPLVTQPPRSLFRKLFTKDIPDLEYFSSSAFCHLFYLFIIWLSFPAGANST